MKRFSGPVKLLWLLSLCAAPVLARGQGQAAAPKDGQPLFLWKVTSPKSTVYLFGSIHVGEKGFYPLPEEVERAFARCKALVLEVDTARADQAAVLRLVTDKGSYPEGQTLWKNIS